MEVHQLEQVLLAGPPPACRAAAPAPRAESPNFDFSPPLLAQRPDPSVASLIRTPTVRLDVHLGGHLEQHVELAQLLEHDHHRVAQLLADQGEAHELLVLVAVADDQVCAVDSLRPSTAISSGLEPHSSPTPCGVPNSTISCTTWRCWLTLTGIDGGVGSLVAEIVDGGLEAAWPVRRCATAGCRRSAAAAAARPPARSRSMAMLYRSTPRDADAVGVHGDVAGLVDPEVAEAPAAHVVQLFGVAGRPRRAARCGLGTRRNGIRSGGYGHRKLLAVEPGILRNKFNGRWRQRAAAGRGRSRQ